MAIANIILIIIIKIAYIKFYIFYTKKYRIKIETILIELYYLLIIKEILLVIVVVKTLLITIYLPLLYIYYFY